MCKSSRIHQRTNPCLRRNSLFRNRKPLGKKLENASIAHASSEVKTGRPLFTVRRADHTHSLELASYSYGKMAEAAVTGSPAGASTISKLRNRIFAMRHGEVSCTAAITSVSRFSSPIPVVE